MKHIVGFSGGAASAYVGYLVAQEFGKDNTILLHHDTQAECPDTARFLQQVSDKIEIPITEASNKKGLWEVIGDNACLPSSFIPFCTRLLKLEPAEKFYKTITDEWILYNGFTVDEWPRVQKATARAESMGRTAKSPLFERNISNEQVKSIIRDEWKICLPKAYQYIEHNNCIPCFKAGQGHFYKVWKHYNSEFQKAKQMEDFTGHTVFKDISLYELERRWKQGNMDSLFEPDYGVPCMCAE